MSGRRGESLKKRDDTFNRNANSSRQLFNPSQHNPVAFNKKTTEAPKTLENKGSFQRKITIEKPIENNDKEAEKKTERKTHVNAVRDIEFKLEQLTRSSQKLACFREKTDIACSRDNLAQANEHLTEQDVKSAEGIWRKKIELHIALAEAYLNMFKFDLEYAEKKGLESLCWKRAIYSLVDQFRKAIKKYSVPIEKPVQNELEAELEYDNELTSQVPIMNDDGTMIMQAVSISPKEDLRKSFENVYASTLLQLFMKYLDLADDFYQKLTQFFETTESDRDNVQSYLSQWKRTKAYKWYSCLPLRGDLARYRWSYTPESQLAERKKEFEETWKRYSIGLWLMPSKGNLYFNLSLLLQTKTNSVGHNFHKLYLSTRSLMVRQNAFMNARENILVFVEGNRRWINRTLESKKKPKSQSNRNTFESQNSQNVLVIGLFIKLHGMLLTKIGLDEFAKTKRLFFDALFPREVSRCKPIDRIERSQEVAHLLSKSEIFCFETAVLCLSSLYSYNYANSKLRKAVDSHIKELFNNESGSDNISALEFENDVLFTFGIDLTCQLAVESFERYLNPELPHAATPDLPNLPEVSFRFEENKKFLFGQQKTAFFQYQNQYTNNDGGSSPWLVYVEILLQWMVLNGLCIRNKNSISFWERFISNIESDLVSKELNHRLTYHSLISPTFWPLLVQFLNRLLSELPDRQRYELTALYLVSNTNDDLGAEQKFFENICKLGSMPVLPEEEQLRGLGWVDEAYSRVLKSGQSLVKEFEFSTTRKLLSTDLQRKARILEYGFTLMNQLKTTLCFDPVDQIFCLSPSVKDRILEQIEKETEKEVDSYKVDDTGEDEEEAQEIPAIIAEMDDDVLLSTERVDLNEEEDDIVAQLKKRKEQLQSMVAIGTQELSQRRRLPVRVKEKEARLDYLRGCVLPDKTVLVLDTNCFIGHLDRVKKLISSEKWTIIVPLVVVTELDGLATSKQKLGSVAEKAIELIETKLTSKARTSNSLRVQTSHNSFLHNIAIRSEQFTFGEADRNLDDLVLSCCLWWISQKKQEGVVPVCLVTGDLNLSVKARARDVEVVPVSAIMSLTPK
ncbi:hypothetical protein BY458DRAFT_590769 [Sporodiniella umbellata]|nr:hypothetical protein BY458DRAFT_590769 [Sporodiniella umbellata]